MSHVVKVVAGVLGITIKHATDRAKTIGKLELSQESIRQALKLETSERRSMWHTYVSIAVHNYNTSYHATIGCELTRVFHGRIACNVLDIKTGIRQEKMSAPN